jgi:hypothetical protein
MAMPRPVEITDTACLRDRFFSNDGDSTEIEAPLVSGAVPPQAGDAQ